MAKTVRERNATTSDQVTTVLSYGALLLLGYVVYEITAPLLVPLAWSAVLAIFFIPLQERLGKKLKPSLAARASTIPVSFRLPFLSLVVLFYISKRPIAPVATAW